MAIKKIITYNLNGIRAALSKGLLDWIRQEDPDIICFQETKAQFDQIPVMEFELAGYHAYFNSALKKGYSGVGILTKDKPDHVVVGMGNEKYDKEGRVIRADYGDISVISVYHPSGTSGDERQDFKFQWLEDFLDYTVNLRKERPNLIISGDYNICHKPIDIHDPVRNAHSSGFLPEEREWLTRFIDSGFIDTFRYFHPDIPHQYTWWSFRMNARERNLGWRIDYNMVTLPLEQKLAGAGIHPQVKHSDHCPASLFLNF
ncbi:MAG: exodeoxyribonuclease III [Bacteroidetes bacterium]|nr:exodeoxyribonuclease III [Bacteroidota bacterium]